MKFRFLPWLGSVVIAACVGWFVRDRWGDWATTENRQAFRPALVPRIQDVRNNPGVNEGSTAKPETGGSYRSRLQDAFSTKDPYVRMRRIMEELEHTNAENVEDLRNTWREYIASGMPKYGLDYFINRSIGKALGAASLSVRTGTRADYDSLGAIGNEIEGAMLSDAKGVRNWYDSLNNEKFREALLGPYIGALAKSDRATALTVMQQLPAEFQSRCVGAIIGGVKSAEGAQAVFAMVRSTLDSPTAAAAPWAGELFEQAISQTTRNRQETVLCAAFLEEMSGKSYASFNGAPHIAQRYAQMYPVEALEWASRMSDKIPPGAGL